MKTRSRQKFRKAPHLELVALRVNRGWSRNDLAYRTGVSAESIRLAEIGFVPGPRIQFALACAFDKTPLDLWPIDRQRVAA